MNKTKLNKSKPGHQEWLGLLARVHQGRVEVANLTGRRAVEEQSIGVLDFLGGRLDDPGLNRDIAKLQTRFHLDTGNLSAALEHSRRLTELARVAGGGEEIAKALSWQAMIHRERSEHERAIEIYAEAEPLMENRIYLAELWQEKGLTHNYLGQYVLAEQLITRALDFFRPLGSTEKKAAAINDLGVCFYQQKQYRKSLELFEEAVGLYLKIGYKLGSATTAGNLVNIQLHLGNIGRALDLARNCLEWGTEIEDQITIGLGHEKLGTVFQILGMPGKAMDHLQKAEECAARTGDFVVRGLVLGLQTEVLTGLGRMEEADAALGKAEELGRETGEEILTFRMEVKRAWMTSLLGDCPRAVERWDEIIRKAEGGADRKCANEARLEKASCLLALGGAVEARRCLEEITAVEESSVFWLLRHRAFGAEVCRASGDPSSAGEHCRQAQRLAAEVLALNREAWIRERLLSTDPLKKLSDMGCI